MSKYPTYYLHVILLFVSHLALSQSVEKSTNASGQFYTNEQAQIGWSLGQVFIPNFNNQESNLSPVLHSEQVTILGVGNSKIDFQFYPNPTKDFLRLVIEPSFQCRIKIYTLKGTLIIDQKLDTQEKEVVEIDLRSLSTGVHVGHIEGPDGQYLEKFNIIKTN